VHHSSIKYFKVHIVLILVIIYDMRDILEWVDAAGIGCFGLEILGLLGGGSASGEDTSKKVHRLIDRHEWNSIYLGLSKFDGIPMFDLDISEVLEIENARVSCDSFCVSVLHMKTGLLEYQYGIPGLVVVDSLKIGPNDKRGLSKVEACNIFGSLSFGGDVVSPNLAFYVERMAMVNSIQHALQTKIVSALIDGSISIIDNYCNIIICVFSTIETSRWSSLARLDSGRHCHGY
jgi:hypothetical protein